MKERMIKIRNELSKIFNENKDNWNKLWCKSLMRSMGELDLAINQIDKPEPKGIKAI